MAWWYNPNAQEVYCHPGFFFDVWPQIHAWWWVP